MAASNLNLGKASGGILSVSPADGTTNTSLVLPASGVVVATDANGNLGLGVSTATLTGAADKAVHIHANTESQIHLTNTTTGNTSSDGSVVSVDSSGNLYLYNKENANTIIGTNNIERLRVDANGNVGIGTNSPEKNLSINGTSGISLMNTSVTGRRWNIKNDSNFNIGYYVSDPNVVTNALTIDANGNIGIGVTPSAWVGGLSVLQLNQSNLTTAAGNDLRLGSNYVRDNTNYKYISNGFATNYTQNSGTHNWQIAPSGTAGNAITWTNAMTLDTSNGLNLNTSYAGSYPAVTMFGNASNNYVQILGRNAANNDIVFNSTVGGVIKAAILANGNFQSATNSYGSTSDAKLKENVVETSDKLDKLMNVRVVNFNYIGDDQKQIGVIAQEVEKIFPGIVYETKDTKQVEVTKTKEVTDEEGNVTTEEYTETETVETGEVTKNVKYSVIYMMMLKGMQEQQAIINDLKARIEILEGAK